MGATCKQPANRDVRHCVSQHDETGDCHDRPGGADRHAGGRFDNHVERKRNLHNHVIWRDLDIVAGAGRVVGTVNILNAEKEAVFVRFMTGEKILIAQVALTTLMTCPM